jgi:DDE superfamily endonuclease
MVTVTLTTVPDYKRNGVIDLFAALNPSPGEVLHATRKTHTGKDILSFFKWIDAHFPRELDVHVVLDNLSAHKSKPVRDWLALPTQSRWHLHFTPHHHRG